MLIRRSLAGNRLMHEVFAHRNGGKPILRCQVCNEEQPLIEGAFDAINTFIQLHTTCASMMRGGR